MPQEVSDISGLFFSNEELDVPDEVPSIHAPRSNRSSSNHLVASSCAAGCWPLCHPSPRGAACRSCLFLPIFPTPLSVRGTSSSSASRAMGRHLNMDGCFKMLQKPPSLQHLQSHWVKLTNVTQDSCSLRHSRGLSCDALAKQQETSLPPSPSISLALCLLDASLSFHLSG